MYLKGKEKREEAGERSTATVRYNRSYYSPEWLVGSRRAQTWLGARIVGYLLHIHAPTVVQTGVSIERAWFENIWGKNIPHSEAWVVYMHLDRSQETAGMSQCCCCSAGS